MTEDTSVVAAQKSPKKQRSFLAELPPNPTTGFLMYVYRSEIVLLDMTIEDGAKLIVSAGLVAPEYKRTVVTKDGAPIEVDLANPTMEKVANLKFK